MCVYIYIYIYVNTCVYTYVNIYIFFQILLPNRLLQKIEYCLLGYRVGPCWLPILYIVVCIC